MISCIDLRRNFIRNQTEFEKIFSAVGESGRYILGNAVSDFEANFANYVGTKYAVAVASGTDAIFLSLIALGIGLNDEILTPSHTATATIAAIEACGARPVFVDVDPDTLTIDSKLIEGLITPKTKAIVCVHLYGGLCNLGRLVDIAKRNNLFLVEDCAQATGSLYLDSHVGSIGAVGCFSFFPTKNLGALGDGGAITTNSEELYDSLVTLRQYGWDDQRRSIRQGYNSRLDELQASILNFKLKQLDHDIDRRIAIARIYDECFPKPECQLPQVIDGCKHSYHLYVVRTTARDELKSFLKSSGIDTLIHYPLPNHKSPKFKQTGVFLPITENAALRILSIPIYPELESGEVEFICEKINEFFG